MGKKLKWLHNPCLLGRLDAGGYITLAITKAGSQSGEGIKIGFITMPSWRPMRGRNCYITVPGFPMWGGADLFEFFGPLWKKSNFLFCGFSLSKKTPQYGKMW